MINDLEKKALEEALHLMEKITVYEVANEVSKILDVSKNLDAETRKNIVSTLNSSLERKIYNPLHSSRSWIKTVIGK